jgi:hypothetical protein
MKTSAFLAFVALFCLFSSAYADRSFTMEVRLNADGRAHIIETTSITLENQTEKDDFSYNLALGESTIKDWKRFSKNIRYHMQGPIASNPKISAKRDFDVSSDAALITIEYDMVNSLVTPEKANARTTKYSFDSSYLMLETSLKGNKTVLGNGVTLIFKLPSGAREAQVEPQPASTENGFKWQGPMVGDWKISYQIEQPMSDEVRKYFAGLYTKAYAMLPQFFLAAMIILSGVFFFLKLRNK